MKDTRKNRKRTIIDDAGAVPVVADITELTEYVCTPDGVRMCSVEIWNALPLEERARIREEVMGY